MFQDSEENIALLLVPRVQFLLLNLRLLERWFAQAGRAVSASPHAAVHVPSTPTATKCPPFYISQVPLLCRRHDVGSFSNADTFLHHSIDLAASQGYLATSNRGHDDGFAAGIAPCV